MTEDMYSGFFDAMLASFGTLLASIVTNPTTLATIAILIVLAILTRLVPARRRRRRR
ncbi:hypothetical protein [Glaciibacter psychrotolerans]|uniref:Uncharacterized protein n=1 Tax=Glaciibacter psychrotolerans TaxID=670054 RepID=A0A7Z0J4V0_9MICO|nr:hypothetical protein [Leifsonia psychrotolerans]NYJ18218.1 hypothetical protein [Leifsonia psychrotolerans]